MGDVYTYTHTGWSCLITGYKKKSCFGTVRFAYVISFLTMHTCHLGYLFFSLFDVLFELFLPKEKKAKNKEH